MLTLVSPDPAALTASREPLPPGTESSAKGDDIFGNLMALLAGNNTHRETPGAESSIAVASSPPPPSQAKAKTNEPVLSADLLATLALVLPPPQPQPAAASPIESAPDVTLAACAKAGGPAPAAKSANQAAQVETVLSEKRRYLPEPVPEPSNPPTPAGSASAPLPGSDRADNASAASSAFAQPTSRAQIGLAPLTEPSAATPAVATGKALPRQTFDPAGTDEETADGWSASPGSESDGEGLRPRCYPLPKPDLQAGASFAADEFNARLEDTADGLGTPAAQVVSGMRKTEKLIKTAEPAKQNLPIGKTVVSPRLETESADPVKVSPQAAIEATIATGSPTDCAPAPVLADTGTSNHDDPRLQTLEHTHNLVAHHALRLQRSESDTLKVLLRPGDTTQISLELRCRNHEVEASAVLRQGDFDFLSRHWTELQQKLELLGVHLAPLDRADSLSGNLGHPDHSGHRAAGAAPDDKLFEEAGLEVAAGASTGNRTAPVHTCVGWESWA